MKFFTKSKTKKLPRAAQKELAPRKEFIEHGKERFLAAFDANALAQGTDAHSAHATRPTYLTIFFKVGIGAMAILCVGVGLSAYADTANVAPTSPLYPLKRLDESVQLAVTPAPEKAQFEATLAVRRANEIEALQTSQPSSTLIPKLTNDLDQDISSSLNMDSSDNDSGNDNSNNNGNNGRVRGGKNFTVSATSTISSTLAASSTSTTSTDDMGPINVYCGAFDVSTSGVFIGRLESNLVLHPRALAEFDRQCGSGKDNSGNNATSTSGISANGNGSIGWHGNRGGAGFGVGGENATTTTSTSTTTIIAATSSFGGHINVRGIPIPHIGGAN